MHVQKVLADAENTKTIDEHLWAVHVWGRMSAENIYNHGDMNCCAPQATDIPTFLILTEILPPSHNINLGSLLYPLKCRAHGTQLRVVGQVEMLMGHGPRKEFDEFIKDKKQAVLFFIALGKLCTRELEDRLSFFQLGGKYTASCSSFPVHRILIE